MAYDEELADRVRAVFPGWTGGRPMFSGLGFMLDGVSPHSRGYIEPVVRVGKETARAQAA